MIYSSEAGTFELTALDRERFDLPNYTYEITTEQAEKVFIVAAYMIDGLQNTEANAEERNAYLRAGNLAISCADITGDLEVYLDTCSVADEADEFLRDHNAMRQSYGAYFDTEDN